MDSRNQLMCLYTGYLFFPVYFIGFGLCAGFIPILSPSWSAIEVAAYFEQHQTGILAGQIICEIASALLVPWAIAIFIQMRRVEGGSGVMSYVQLGLGVIGAVFFMLPSFVWATMAYRNGHNPDILLIMNDFAWIAWVISWPPFAFQAVAIAVVVLGNPAQTLFPRWAAYASLWLALAMVPASLAVFFYDGPFAWNGLVAVYLPLVVYAIWWHVIFISVYKAIKNQAKTVPST